MKKKFVIVCIELYIYLVVGWGVLKVVMINLIKEKVVGGNYCMLLCQNQLDGFDCLGCVWFDCQYVLMFEFCENGVKVVVVEVMSKCVMFDFFVVYMVIELFEQLDFEFEQYGWFIDLMVYDVWIDCYVLIVWDDVFELIVCYLCVLFDLNQVVFYMFGCVSNEVVFLY